MTRSITGLKPLYNNNMSENKVEEVRLFKGNNLPINSAWLFPEHDFDSMNLDDYQGVIIERVLERGSWTQLRWLFKTYGESLVADWVRKHGFRLLSKRSFALWRLTLGIIDYTATDWMIAAKEMEPW
jgi:hypothetical protein